MGNLGCGQKRWTVAELRAESTLHYAPSVATPGPPYMADTGPDPLVRGLRLDPIEKRLRLLW